jgi:carbamoyltransferase
MPENIIGISAHFHDAACCLIQNEALVADVEEERFSRRKHDSGIPRLALRYCLEEGGITINNVDCVAYYEDASGKPARQIWMMSPGLPKDRKLLSRLDAQRPEREIRENLGYDGPIEYVSHHYAHAASSFYSY